MKHSHPPPLPPSSPRSPRPGGRVPSGLAALRSYSNTAAMAAAGYAGDSPLFLLDYLLRFLRVAVLLSLWRMLLADRGPVSGMSVEAVLTYTLVAELFAQQLNVRTELMWELWQGSLAVRMLRPVGMVAQFAAEMMGRWCFGLGFFTLPLLLAAPLLGVNPLPASGWAALWFVPSLALAVSVGLALEFIFGALMIHLEQSSYIVNRLREAVTVLLSGALVPLALLPEGVGTFFSFLPFASMASAPLRIYTGTGSPLLLMGVQAAWCLLLWPLAGWLWRANRERLVGYGG